MACSDKNPVPTPASGAGGGAAAVPGQPTTLASQMLDMGAKATQSLKPVKQIKQHVCTFALYSHDPKRQIETHHYVARLNQDVLQCAVYDSDASDARLIACLKLLSLRNLDNLDFPEGTRLDSVVKRIIYKSDVDDYDTFHSETNSTYLLQHAEATRFNLFTGFQTLSEREDSFKINGTVSVHCGFYSDNGGFKISDEDKRYMGACKVVVSTCAFGGGDDLYQPIGMANSSIGRVCYVAFWDEVTLSTQEAEGKVIGDDGMIGRWRIIVVKGLPFVDQRLNGKIPKMLTHRLFPEARYSIWVDSKYQFRRDPIGVLEAILWRTNSTFAISEHGARSHIYEEGKAIVHKHKATPEEVEVQLNQYRQDGMPDEKRFNGLKALAEASVILRELNPATNHFMCAWFNEVVRFTSRDQLSFPYVLWRLNMPGMRMFPVCTRRDLVNSLGHTRKVKPLAQTNSESSVS